MLPDAGIPGPERLGAVVLAGGQSSRMGTDKAALDWDGRPLVAHVAATLGALISDGPIIVAGPHRSPAWAARLPSNTELQADPRTGEGPVPALVAALAALAGRATRALVAATDQPLLAAATFTPLLQHPGTVAWRADGRLQPLGAVYRVASAPAGARRLTDMLAHATILDADAATAATLRSLDTQAAYRAARSRG